MAFDDDAPAPAPAPKTPAAAPSQTDAIVDDWFNSTFPGSVIARTTEAWNLLHNALPALKARLNGKG